MIKVYLHSHQYQNAFILYNGKGGNIIANRSNLYITCNHFGSCEQLRVYLLESVIEINCQSLATCDGLGLLCYNDYNKVRQLLSYFWCNEDSGYNWTVRARDCQPSAGNVTVSGHCYPTTFPTAAPTDRTVSPTEITAAPTLAPTVPTLSPTLQPTMEPSIPSLSPTYGPTMEPTTGAPTTPTIAYSDDDGSGAGGALVGAGGGIGGICLCCLIMFCVCAIYGKLGGDSDSGSGGYAGSQKSTHSGDKKWNSRKCSIIWNGRSCL